LFAETTIRPTRRRGVPHRFTQDEHDHIAELARANDNHDRIDVQIQDAKHTTWTLPDDG
jgi:hypothetical protein